MRETVGDDFGDEVMAKAKLNCLTCLQNGTQCENLVGLYKLDKITTELRLDVVSRVLRCPKNGLHYELTPKGGIS